MLVYIINTLVVIATFFFMEGVAWFTHKYIMHGSLWNLHEDHHYKGEGQFFEKNDSFFVIFAIPSASSFIFGSIAGFDKPYFYIGVGIALYGIAYFLIHDVFIHQRFKWLRNANSAYFRAIRRAHKVHHKHLGKEDGECFGMLWVPLKYYKEAQRDIERQKAA